MGKIVRFEIPPGTKPSTCRGCGAIIFWVRSAHGRNMPLNSDGQSHFSTCPKAAAFRKKQ